MDKHTPGPWKVNSVFPDKSKGHTFEPSVYIMGDDPEYGGCRLADIPDVMFENDQQMANARLIATAPRMLETLKEAASWYDLVKQNYPEMVSLVRALGEARAIMRDVEES